MKPFFRIPHPFPLALMVIGLASLFCWGFCSVKTTPNKEHSPPGTETQPDSPLHWSPDHSPRLSFGQRPLLDRVYHVQGRIAGDYGEKDKSLNFHRKAISYAPLGTSFPEIRMLLSAYTRKTDSPSHSKPSSKTLDVHRVAWSLTQNKIAVYPTMAGKQMPTKLIWR